MENFKNKILKMLFVCVVLFCIHSFPMFAADLVEIKNGVKTTHEEVPRPVIDTYGKNYDLKWTLDKQGHWKLYVRKINGRTLNVANSWVKVGKTIDYYGTPVVLFDYYYFDYYSNLVTGWYVDVLGNTYYLMESGDNIGSLAKEWCMINGSFYYFGADGVLKRNTVTPEGFMTDGDGKWR